MGMLRIMDLRKGDDAYRWGDVKTKTDDVLDLSVEEVKKKFNDLVEAGWTVFDTSAAPKESKVFDEKALEYIAVPRIAGG